MIRKCEICKKEFETTRNIKRVCSWKCRQEANRENSRKIMRLKRHKKNNQPCIVCGWNFTSDNHHEGGQTIILCPNHHSMITRGIVQSYKNLLEHP